MRAMVAMTMALAVTHATRARALTKPPLNALVAETARHQRRVGSVRRGDGRGVPRI